MPIVKIQRACSCFEKSKYDQVNEFETIDEALDFANDMCVEMNETFCTKHHFKAIYEDGNMIIKADMNG